MKTSQNGLAFIMANEGMRVRRYRDQAGLWTIGVGHLIRPGEVFQEPLTREQCLSLLASDVRGAEAAVSRLITRPLSQNQFDALVDFTFNVGDGALQHSTLRLVVNRGDFADVPSELRKWCRARGRVVSDLLKRRLLEAHLFQCH